MQRLDRITIDPDQMNGQPCIRGMRLTVKRVLEALSMYPDKIELLREYPDLENDDISQVLAYASLAIDDSITMLDEAA
jgi:uncharacterized protein (DUF433 family)